MLRSSSVHSTTKSMLRTKTKCIKLVILIYANIKKWKKIESGAARKICAISLCVN